MRKLLSILLILTLMLGMTACTKKPSGQTQNQTQTGEKEPVKDVSGKYDLDAARNEAIINDTGGANTAVDGNGRVYYHIFVGSFSDSNGDGIGDLRGIINRFDYLNDGDPHSGVSLGVEGIWLSPIFTSPSYHKYDVTNYYTIDPDFGTMEDLKELIELCHSRGVQIILDMVINHTSTANSWYQSFVDAHQSGNTSHEYYDFYTHASQPASGRTFQLISGSDDYYECNFSSGMPELNFDNDAVRQAVLDIAKFYLDLGVDGFRFDAAKYIYFGEESRNVEFWTWYMAQLRAIKPDIYTVAEVWDGDNATFPYFAATNCFNFTMAQAEGLIASAARGGNIDSLASYVQAYLETIKAQNPDAMMVTFLANHDTDRAAGFLPVSTGVAQVAANISILMPGSTFIYYGEEIGMKGSRGGASTDANRRLAMLWGDGDTVKNPIGTDYSGKQNNGTVADQLPNGDSLYNYYKRLIAIRRANPEIAYGEYTALRVNGSKAGGFLSTYEGKTVAVFHNPTQESVTIELSKVTDVELEKLAAVIGLGNATLEGTTLTIDGQTSVVLR